MTNIKPITILIADDDEEDRMLIMDAIEESEIPSQVYFVKDGEEAMDYLHQRGKYGQGVNAPRPGIILLDLNMPRKDGRETLQEIKSDPNLKQIPVIILTTSKLETDINTSYDLGANTYITKPANFDSLVEIIKTIGSYWFSCVELPLKN